MKKNKRFLALLLSCALTASSVAAPITVSAEEIPSEVMEERYVETDMQQNEPPVTEVVIPQKTEVVQPENQVSEIELTESERSAENTKVSTEAQSMEPEAAVLTDSVTEDYGEQGIDALTSGVVEEVETQVSNAPEAVPQSEAETEDNVIFDQTTTVDGVQVKVFAEAGGFPTGAKLSVSKADSSIHKEVQTKLDAILSDKGKVSASYTFDIKVVGDNGQEIEPDTNKGKISVSFVTEKVADDKLDVEVYHIEDHTLIPEKLNSSVSGSTVVAETDRFSYYTLLFLEKKPEEPSQAPSALDHYVGLVRQLMAEAKQLGYTETEDWDEALAWVENPEILSDEDYLSLKELAEETDEAFSSLSSEEQDTYMEDYADLDSVYYPLFTSLISNNRPMGVANRPSRNGVTFSTNGVGSNPSGIDSLEAGELVPKPSVTAPAGYELVGWYKDSPDKLWDFDKDTKPSGRLTLYAKWRVTDPDVVKKEITLGTNGDKFGLEPVGDGTFLKENGKYYVFPGIPANFKLVPDAEYTVANPEYAVSAGGYSADWNASGQYYTLSIYLVNQENLSVSVPSLVSKYVEVKLYDKNIYTLKNEDPHYTVTGDGFREGEDGKFWLENGKDNVLTFTGNTGYYFNDSVSIEYWAGKYEYSAANYGLKKNEDGTYSFTLAADHLRQAENSLDISVSGVQQIMRQVSFQSNTSKNPDSVEVAYGSTVTQPEVAKSRSTLVGWYTDPNFAEDAKWDFNTPVTEDMTLYAKWESEMFAVKDGVLWGLNRDWVKENKPQDGSVRKIDLVIPADVTEIVASAFNYDYYRPQFDVYTASPEDNNIQITSVDFSQATNLEKIGYYSFAHIDTLTGTLDLSMTKVSEIENTAFAETGITAVKLPNTLKKLGGSVFTKCNLQGILLPEGLESIGELCFRWSFQEGAVISIPASVDSIGQEAFGSETTQQITVERTTGFQNWSEYAFQQAGIVVFQNKDSFNEAVNTYKLQQGGVNTLLTYQVPVKIYVNGEYWQTIEKIYNAQFWYEKDSSGFWNKNENYEFPVPEKYNTSAVTRTLQFHNCKKEVNVNYVFVKDTLNYEDPVDPPEEIQLDYTFAMKPLTVNGIDAMDSVTGQSALSESGEIVLREDCSVILKPDYTSLGTGVAYHFSWKDGDGKEIGTQETLTLTYQDVENIESISVKVTATLQEDSTLTSEKEISRAVQRISSHEVTFDSKGGSAVETQSVDHGTQAILPDTPTKEDCVFEGWFIQNGTAWDFNTPVTQDITLEAKWSPAMFIIREGVLYGINQEWYQENKAEGSEMQLSLTIPANVTSIAYQAFAYQPGRTSSSYYEKTTAPNGNFQITGIDFSQAANLTEISQYAFYQQGQLSGTIDLSSTSVETLGSGAFKSTSITGAVLPETLTTLGDLTTGAGVFAECYALTFVGTAASQSTGQVVLPSSVTQIGKQCFRNSFAGSTRIIIPAKVSTVGDEAFNGSKVPQIDVLRESGFNNWSTESVKAFSGNRLVIFPSAAAYTEARERSLNTFCNTQTYALNVLFEENNATIETQQKLYNLNFKYQKGADGLWTQDSSYTFPSVSAVVQPGFSAGWKFELSKKTAAETDRVVDGSGTPTQVKLIYNSSLLPPTVVQMNCTSGVTGKTSTLSGYSPVTVHEDSYITLQPVLSKPEEGIAYEYLWIGVDYASNKQTRMGSADQVTLTYDQVTGYPYYMFFLTTAYVIEDEDIYSSTVQKYYLVTTETHTWDNGTITTQPTCTEEGVRTYICDVCHKTREEQILALGHDFADEFTIDCEPTCTETGSKSKHCSRCEAVQDQTSIPALGHDWVYTASGNTVTAECSHSNVHVGNTVTLTITAKDATYEPQMHYSGASVVNHITEETGEIASDIVFSDTPDHAGEFTAQVTIGGKTAKTSFVIRPKEITVTVDSKSKVYGSLDPELTYTAHGDVGQDELKDITVTRAPGENAGTYEITASEEKGANKNYSITFKPGTFTIKAKEVILSDANISITGDGSFIYDGTEKKPAVVVMDGDKVIPASEYTVSYKNNVNASKDITDEAEKPVVIITDNEGGNYVVSGSKTFEIAKADPELSVSAVPDKTYGDEAFKLAVTKTGESSPTFTSSDEKVLTVEKDGKVTLVGAGKATVTVSMAESRNYNAKETKVEITVKKKDAALAVGKIVYEVTYGDPDFKIGEITKEGESDVTFQCANESVVKVDETGAVSIKKVGETKITLSMKESANYKAVAADVSVKVVPKKITVTADDASKEYGSVDKELGYTPAGLVGNDQLEKISVNRVAGENAGKYVISASQEQGANSNYEITFVNGTFIINPKTITVKADAKSKVYGAKDPELTYTATGLVGKDALKDITATRADGEAVGTYEITLSQKDGANANYAITFVTDTFTIGTKAVTVTADSKVKTYGDKDTALTYQTEGLVDGESVDVTLSREAGENVGTYKITASQAAGANSNYAITFVDGTYTINKKAATVTADDKSKSYGDADAELTYKAEGLVEGDSLEKITLSRKAGEDVGTYAITAVQADGANKNYDLTFKAGTYAIGQKAITVTANNASKTYGAADPVLTYKADGLVGTDTLSDISTTRESAENVGTYTITASQKDDSNSNYKITFADGTFTIHPKEVTLATKDITINGDGSFVYDGTEKKPSVVVMDGDKVIPASEYTVSYKNNVNASKDITDEAEKPVVIITDNEGGNYVVSGSKTFEIAKADPELSVSAVPDKTYGDEAFKLAVTKTGESSPTFTSSDKAVLTVDQDGKVTLIGAGKATVTVTMAESQNYNEKSVNVEINVQKKDASLTVEQMSYEVTYGDADFSISGLITEGESGVKYINSDDSVVTVDENGKVSIKKVGEAVITLSMTESANYKPVSATVTVKVMPKDITGATVELDGTLIYTGKEQTQEVKSVMIDGLHAIYDVTDNQATKAGEYTLKITGNGNFTGTIEQKFTIAKQPGDITYVVEADPAAPHTEIGASEQEMIGMLATPEELAAIENGDSLKIWVEITDASATISSASKQLIQNAASDYKVGAYIDISLFKKLATADHATQITGTNKPITVSVTIPENLRNSDPKIKRSYVIVRVHEGVAEILPTTQNGNTLTFTTDKFSDYAIMYKDENVSDDNGGNGNNGNNNTGNSNSGSNGSTSTTASPQTGDETNLMLWLLLMMLGLSGMVGTGIYRKKSSKNA